MNVDVFRAIALIVGASIMNAAFALPMRANRKWAWENSWFAFSILGIAVVPTLIAVAAVPGIWSIYPSVEPGTLLTMALFGGLWGVSQVLFGLALPVTGIAICFAVSLGTSAACGALVPLLMQHPAELPTGRGLLIVCGILLIAAGVGSCAAAGRLRDRSAIAPVRAALFLRGVLYALGSGLLGSMLNAGFAAGAEVQRMAAAQGASPAVESIAVWLPCLYAGFLPGVVYCLYLMRKNGTTRQLVRESRWYYAPMAALMGALWFGSIVLYSLATASLGTIGAAIGWPLFMSAIVIVSMATGLIAGEWKGAGRRALLTMSGGILLLVVAIVLLSAAVR